MPHVSFNPNYKISRFNTNVMHLYFKTVIKNPFLNLNGQYKKVITKLQVHKIKCFSYLLSSYNSIFDIP